MKCEKCGYMMNIKGFKENQKENIYYWECYHCGHKKNNNRKRNNILNTIIYKYIKLVTFGLNNMINFYIYIILEETGILY